MIAAIVVPAGVHSIAMIRACLVSGRAAGLEDEGVNRVRDLVLFVDRGVEAGGGRLRSSIWVWLTELPRGLVRRDPPHHLSPAEQTTRQGAIPWGASGHPSRYSNAPIEDESQSFLSKWSPEGPKSRLPYRGLNPSLSAKPVSQLFVAAFAEPPEKSPHFWSSLHVRVRRHSPENVGICVGDVGRNVGRMSGRTWHTWLVG